MFFDEYVFVKHVRDETGFVEFELASKAFDCNPRVYKKFDANVF